jgi:ABC-2 type transport system permease protein
MKEKHTAIEDCCYIWAQEMKQVIRDEGVLIFFILVPLIYPLLYSWIYNNEVVHEVPVVVVDQSHTALSRQFIRMCDASPDVSIRYHASDLDEARMLVSRQVVKGIYLIPSDFADHVGRMEPATISVYCDMSLMLAYKAVFQTAQTVSTTMGSQITTALGGHITARDAQVSARPLDFDEVPLFNPSGGYGSFVIPGVLMLILQQTLVLGIGLSAGTARERNRYGNLIPISRHYQGVMRILFGKALCYFMVYAVMGSYLALVVPRLFGFCRLAQWPHLLMLMLPYLMACIFFGMVMSCMVRYRENVMLLMVFVSVPLLFLCGVSWPQSAIPGFWQGVSWLFPSTFGVRAFVRMNSMGATLSDVAFEYHLLWAQAIVYFCLASVVYRHQVVKSRRDARKRVEQIGRKEKVRQLIQQKQIHS